MDPVPNKGKAVEIGTETFFLLEVPGVAGYNSTCSLFFYGCEALGLTEPM